MSSYCVECGAHLAGGHFCPECGHAVAPAPQPGDPPGAAAAGSAAPRRPLGLRQHPAAIAAIVVAIVASLGLGAFAVHAQVRNAEQEAATGAAQRQAREAQEQAAVERLRAKKARAKARAAKARYQAEQRAPEVSVVPPPASPYSGPIDGSWSGTMANGRYTFWLTLSEYGGYVSGEMYQQDTGSGQDGVEVLEGYRDGGVLYLRGVSWRSAPAGWSLDRISLTMAPNGTTFTGTYTCDACAPSNPISGRRE